MKSIAASQPSGPLDRASTTSWPASASAGTSSAPDLPGGAVQRDPHQAAFSSSAGIDALDGLGEPALVRADPRDGEALRREERVRELRDLRAR